MRNRETEVKIRIADVKATRKRLREMGFRLFHRRSLEDNTLFDTPDRALRQVRSILRLRHYGGQWLVTFKGTPAADPNYKSRLELETTVKQPQVIRSIFQALGFCPVFRYQKYRSHFVPGGKSGPRKASFDVALDETPIGNFLELEGTPAWIDRVARQLGYSRSDYSTASYGALYLEECLQKNIPPGDMVFEALGARDLLILQKTGKTS
jgi:adenylate cyclase class 2